jgi:hypothetical protein
MRVFNKTIIGSSSMISLFRKKKPVAPPVPMDVQNADAKSAVVSSLKNDLLGADEWKKSKLGYITGFTVAGKALGSITNSARDSTTRTKSLWADIMRSQTPDVPELDDPARFGDARERFEVAMKVQGVSAQDLIRILRNTKRAGYLYGSLTLGSIIVVLGSYVMLPPGGIIEIVTRFGLSILLFALTFKNTFTNWCVRNRVATGPMDYLKSGSLLPKDL